MLHVSVLAFFCCINMCVYNNAEINQTAETNKTEHVKESKADPIAERNFIVFGIFCGIIVFIFLYCIFIYINKKNTNEKLSMMETPENDVTHWIKNNTIERQDSECNVSEDALEPLFTHVVKIEKLKQFQSQSVNGNFDSNDQYKLPLDDDWELSRETLKLGKVLGEGEFGKVVLAEGNGLLKQGINSIVAVKMLKDDHSDADMLALVSEMEIMKIIGKHINIINLLGCCTQNGPLYVAVEYAPYGNLRDFLRNCRARIVNGTTVTYQNALEAKNPLTQKDLVSFSCQIARGMKYLASRQCIHCDLAARNVLVSDSFVLKISDFGLAKHVQSKDYYKKKVEGKLPIRWMAPESLYHRIFTTQSDVWSFGVLIWEILTMGGIPYSTIPIENVFDHLIAGKRLNKPERCSSELYLLMKGCWSFQPSKRPTFSDLVEELDIIRDFTIYPEILQSVDWK